MNGQSERSSANCVLLLSGRELGRAVIGNGTMCFLHLMNAAAHSRNGLVRASIGVIPMLEQRPVSSVSNVGGTKPMNIGHGILCEFKALPCRVQCVQCVQCFLDITHTRTRTRAHARMCTESESHWTHWTHWTHPHKHWVSRVSHIGRATGHMGHHANIGIGSPPDGCHAGPPSPGISRDSEFLGNVQ